MLAGAIAFGTVYAIRTIWQPRPQPPATDNAPQFQIWPGATETKLWVEFSPDNFFEWSENCAMKIFLSNATQSEMDITGFLAWAIHENTGSWTPLLLVSKPPSLPPGHVILLYEKNGVAGDTGSGGFFPGAIPEKLPGRWRIDIRCWTNVENFQISAWFTIASPT